LDFFGQRRLEIFISPNDRAAPAAQLAISYTDRRNPSASPRKEKNRTEQNRIKQKNGAAPSTSYGSSSEEPKKKKKLGEQNEKQEKQKGKVKPELDSSRIYIVKKGDTLTQIAARLLGSARFVKDILRVNPQIKDSNKLKVGEAIVLPVELTGSRVASPLKKESSDQVKNRDYLVVIVKKGDTLFRIAKKYLGSGSRWKEIYEASKDILEGKKILLPGMKLRVPRKDKNQK